MGALLVGELNPYGADPRFALYHRPRGASGYRLRRILGFSDGAYARLSKLNLCSGRWSNPEARRRAEELVRLSDHNAFVLLGEKVRAAFGGPPPFTSQTIEGTVLVLATIPHLSGRNLAWNDPTALGRARALLCPLLPAIPSDDEWRP